MGRDYRALTIKDVREALDQKYLFRNAFDEGYRLPAAINEVIGFGAYVPLKKVDDFTGNPDIGLAVGFAKINSDLYMSLSTPLGTRFMNPDFGSTLHSLLFEPYDELLLIRLRNYTVSAVSKDVRKVSVVSVIIDDSQKDYNLLQLRIEYLVANTNQPGNYVYPFVHMGEPIRY